MLSRKPNTTIVHQDAILDIEAFINHLKSSATVAKPIGDLLILSHGNDNGFMSIDLDSSGKNFDGTSAENTTYDVLEQAVVSHSVQIPPSLHTGPTGPVDFDVHISGCLIGQTPPFVNKLKEAFDTPRTVTAPKHLHTAGYKGHKSRYDLYSFESLKYYFQLFRQPDKSFQTKEEAVDAFDNQGFTFIKNGATAERVPRSLWEKLIPKYVTITGTSTTHDYFKIGQNIGHGVTKLRLAYEFEYAEDDWTVTVGPLSTVPGTLSERVKILKDSVRAAAPYQSTHPFPIYVRLGYNNVEDFLDGYRWYCPYSKDTKLMACTGTRSVYSISVPIVDPATHKLFLNLYPASGSGYVGVSNLKRSDDRLFLIV